MKMKKAMVNLVRAIKIIMGKLVHAIIMYIKAGIIGLFIIMLCIGNQVCEEGDFTRKKI